MKISASRVRAVAAAVAFALVFPAAAIAQQPRIEVSATSSDTESSYNAAYTTASDNAVFGITTQCQSKGLGLSDNSVDVDSSSEFSMGHDHYVTVTVTANGYCSAT